MTMNESTVPDGMSPLDGAGIGDLLDELRRRTHAMIVTVQTGPDAYPITIVSDDNHAGVLGLHIHQDAYVRHLAKACVDAQREAVLASIKRDRGE